MTRAGWLHRVRAFVPGWLAVHPVLGRFASRAVVIFHGSTMRGVDDAGSDLDFWLLLPAADMRRLRRASRSTFFGIEIDGKNGHMNAESVEDFAGKVRHCDMDAIAQLRYAGIVRDRGGTAARLVRTARKPMRAAVRRAWFYFHYVEMRGEHRACDNPMSRGHSAAVLLSLTKVLAHALRAACVLDGRPYHYDKWLYHDARACPTGRRIVRRVNRIVALLARGGLKPSVMRRGNPVDEELWRIRLALINAAHGNGIHAEWLKRWWHYMDSAREAPLRVRW